MYYMRYLIEEGWNGKWVNINSPEAVLQDLDKAIVNEAGQIWVPGKNHVDTVVLIENRPIPGPINKYIRLLVDGEVPGDEDHIFPFDAVSPPLSIP
jgi:hypothetical protein